MGSVTDSVIFNKDESFWNGYLKGRPQAPDSFFARILQYHEDSGGQFNLAHDAGAGNGPYAQRLRARFKTVIVSDIGPENVRIAEDRLGTDGFIYRVSRIEDGGDIVDGSVDLVFATNVFHFAEQEAAVETIARQLRPGGTLVIAAFGSARFRDAKIQDAWARLTHQAGRALLKHADKPEETRKVISRSSAYYNVAPLSEGYFKPGVKRIHLNMAEGGLTSLLPPEEKDQVSEPSYTGLNDVEVFEDDDGWAIRTNLDGVKSHFASFPFSTLDPPAYAELWVELAELLKDGRVVEAYFPSKIILATRK